MTRSAIAVFFAAVLIFSCKPKQGAPISQKQMESIMLDISIAESYSIMAKDNQHPGGTKNTDSLALYYQEIFDHHHITKEQFEQSLDWYKQHADEMDTLYSRITVTAGHLLTDEGKKHPSVPTNAVIPAPAGAPKKDTVLAKPGGVPQ